MYKFPQILLLGNGLNILNGGESWKEFLNDIKDESTDVDINQLKSPMPLQAILISNNSIDKKLKLKRDKLLPKNRLKDDKFSLAEFLSLGFDEILTTNYTYELEQACFGGKPLSEYRLNKLTASTYGNEVDKRILINTYNKVVYQEKEKHIWHIHGEAKKPSSMILGHYYYLNLVNKVTNYCKNKGNYYELRQKENKPINISSWIDAFIMGDVYIVGQSFDFGESDLWWLLNRKYNEKAEHGKVYFYEPYIHSQREKIKLLKVFKVDCRDLDISETTMFGETKIDYDLFYKKALEDIKKEIKEKNKNGKICN